MAIQERDIHAVANINTAGDVDLQVKQVFESVLDTMQQDVVQLEANVDISIGYSKVEIKAIPHALPIITPVGAAASYFERLVRVPLSQAVLIHDQPSSGIFDSLTRGVYFLSSALKEADGAMRMGVPAQVLTELVDQAKGLTPVAREDFIGRHRLFRTFLANRRMEIYMRDKTAGELLWREYSDMLDLSEGKLPYFEEVDMSPDTLDKTSVIGGEFVLDAYRIIYPVAKAKLGEGIVVSQ